MGLPAFGLRHDLEAHRAMGRKSYGCETVRRRERLSPAERLLPYQRFTAALRHSSLIASPPSLSRMTSCPGSTSSNGSNCGVEFVGDGAPLVPPGSASLVARRLHAQPLGEGTTRHDHAFRSTWRSQVALRSSPECARDNSRIAVRVRAILRRSKVL